MKHCSEANALVDGAEEQAVGRAAAARLCRHFELIPLDRLAPYKGNARTHSGKQIRQIADSVKRFGFNNPVLIDDDGEIIAGHGRVAAAKLLGLTAVPTLRLSHLSAAEKRAYVLADNKLAEKAGWDRGTLAIELQGLIEVDFDVELTGFEIPEIEVLLEANEKSKRTPVKPKDKATAVTNPAVSRGGDVWLLSNHRLVCGDVDRNGNAPDLDIIIRYWQAHTGKSATLAATGQTFEQVQGQRASVDATTQRPSFQVA